MFAKLFCGFGVTIGFCFVCTIINKLRSIGFFWNLFISAIFSYPQDQKTKENGKNNVFTTSMRTCQLCMGNCVYIIMICLYLYIMGSKNNIRQVITNSISIEIQSQNDKTYRSNSNNMIIRSDIYCVNESVDQVRSYYQININIFDCFFSRFTANFHNK